jgi:hypothetical protein
LEELVFGYLNKIYYVAKPLRINWILNKGSNERIFMKTLVDELTDIFSLHKEVVTYLIKEWAHKFYPSADLTEYWDYGESGIIYMPYVQVQQIEVISADDFQPSQGIATRYAQRQVNPNFYGVINPNSQIDFRP